MGLYLFTCEALYSGESPIFVIGCIPTIAYEVTFPSVAENRRVVTNVAYVVTKDYINVKGQYCKLCTVP